MQLSDVLSKPPGKEYKQIEGFLQNKKGFTGQSVNISTGKVALNFFCKNCDDIRTFYSQKTLSCIFVNRNLISVDCVLTCSCGVSVPVWYLVESSNDMTGLAPEVRIIKKTIGWQKCVANISRYEEYSDLLDKAERAYNEGLGAGAMVYLRKVFERVTIQTARAMGIEYQKRENGNPRNFSDLLRRVDVECSIIPKEFSENGYQLFQELSNVIHGSDDEEVELTRFDALYRLVTGILDNVKNHQELLAAMAALGWNNSLENDVNK